jgi:hypothetical protein
VTLDEVRIGMGVEWLTEELDEEKATYTRHIGAVVRIGQCRDNVRVQEYRGNGIYETTWVGAGDMVPLNNPDLLTNQGLCRWLEDRRARQRDQVDRLLAVAHEKLKEEKTKPEEPYYGG